MSMEQYRQSCRMELEELDTVESREGIKTTHEIVVVKIQQLEIG